MKCHRSNVVIFGTCLLLAISPTFVLAQGASGASGGSSGGSSSYGSSSGGSSSGGSSSGGLTSGITTSSSTTATITPSTGGGSSANSIPSSSNNFGPYMANPLSRGLASSYYPNGPTFGTPNTATPIFGKALYTSTTNTTTGSGASTTTSQSATGFSSTGQLRAPPYLTMLSPDVPLKTHDSSQLLQSVRSLLERSSFLSNQQNIQVSVEGGVVVLQGVVQNDRERRLTEGVVRMTPGVRDVQNQLAVAQAQK